MWQHAAALASGRRVDKRCTEAADKCRRSHCTIASRAVRFLAPDHGSMLLKWWVHLTVPCRLPCGQEGYPMNATTLPRGQEEEAGHPARDPDDGRRTNRVERTSAPPRPAPRAY